MTTTSTYTVLGFRTESGTTYHPGYVVYYDEQDISNATSISTALSCLSNSTTTNLGMEIKVIPSFHMKRRSKKPYQFKHKLLSKPYYYRTYLYKGIRSFAHNWGIAR